MVQNKIEIGKIWKSEDSITVPPPITVPSILETLDFFLRHMFHWKN